MADFMRIKDENPRMKQSQIANQIGLSTSTLQRYRNDINLLSPSELIQITLKNEQKRLQIVILTLIHTTSLTLKDLK